MFLIIEIYYLFYYLFVIRYSISCKIFMKFIFFICKIGNKICNSYYLKRLREEKKLSLMCVI